MNASRVLVLEDSLIIAMEAEDMLRAGRRGESSISSSGLDQAMDAVEVGKHMISRCSTSISARAMSFGFARHLESTSGIPFGFVSGYSDTRRLPTRTSRMCRFS